MAVKRGSVVALGLCLFLSSSVPAQMVLNNFYSRAVKVGQSMEARVDSLFVDTKVNSGLAVTRVTMCVAPLPYYYPYDTLKYPATLDSIEMSLAFTLPADFVADSLWLWVNGVPQEAYIQDKALAEAQYQKIVGQRYDPAILQYDGYGNYSLRVFPATAFVARKIAMQFHHTLDDGSSIAGTKATDIAASLPITFDTLYPPYDPSNPYYQLKPKIGYMRLSCNAGDARTYSVSMPGIGSGEFSSAKPLALSGSTIGKLDIGVITAADPSGTINEFLWTGRDLKTPKMTAGFSVKLQDKNLSYLPEPPTRIIIVDVRDGIWNWNDYYAKQAAANGYPYTPNPYYSAVNVWDRAQKYAILAIQQYIKPDQAFNVIISGAAAKSVFEAPVPGDDIHKAKAAAAILGAKPDASANIIEAFRAAIAQAPLGIVVCISDIFQPPVSYVKGGAGTVPSPEWLAYDTLLMRIDSLAERVPELTLFSICDEWRLSGIAMESGGYPIGGLRNRFAIPYTYTVVNGEKVMLLQMPQFFGSSNPTGACRLSVKSGDIEDVVFTLETYGMYYAYPGYSPWYNYSIVNPMLRVAGRCDIGAYKNAMTFTVTGKMGGLAFAKDFTASTDYLTVVSAYRPDEDVQWAFRKSEWLAASNLVANAAAIKQIGKEYHIVTRQTSLLALEPGMTLWVDSTAVASQGSSGGSPSPVFPNPAINSMQIMAYAGMIIDGAPYSSSMYGSGFDIDSITMESISKVGVLPIVKTADAKRAPIATVSGRTIWLRLPERLSGPVSIALYDLSGRRCAFRTVEASRFAATPFAWDVSAQKSLPARGNYILRISAQGFDYTCKLPIIVRR